MGLWILHPSRPASGTGIEGCTGVSGNEFNKSSHIHTPLITGDARMKKRGELWTLASLALVGLLIAGCADEQTGPGDAEGAPVGVTTEQEAIEDYAVNDPFVANDEE